MRKLVYIKCSSNHLMTWIWLFEVEVLIVVKWFKTSHAKKWFLVISMPLHGFYHTYYIYVTCKVLFNRGCSCQQGSMMSMWRTIQRIEVRQCWDSLDCPKTSFFPADESDRCWIVLCRSSIYSMSGLGKEYRARIFGNHLLDFSETGKLITN